jgi:hypothetical protein
VINKAVPQQGQIPGLRPGLNSLNSSGAIAGVIQVF